MHRPLKALAIFLVVTPPAMAQEVLGTIEARLEDNVRTWFVTRDGGQSQSDWRQSVPGLVDVSLWGHATGNTATSVNEALVLDFDVMTTSGVPVVVEPTLQYLSDGYRSGWLALDDSSLSVAIETFDPSGTGLTIAGTFTATLAYSTDPMKQILDPSRTQTVEGRFTATLPND